MLRDVSETHIYIMKLMVLFSSSIYLYNGLSIHSFIFKYAFVTISMYLCITSFHVNSGYKILLIQDGPVHVQTQYRYFSYI